MARITKAQKKALDASIAKREETPEGFDEVGDHWDEMFTLEDDHPEIMGIYRQTAENIGEYKSNVHILMQGTTRVGVWGSTLLDSRMACVTPGNIVLIRYKGLAVSPKSGRDYQVYKVYEKKAKPTTGSGPVDDIPF